MHPVDKYDVGHRLALAARKLAYGEKIVGMGPLYKKMSVKGNKIILEFTNQGKKLVMGTSPYIPAGKPPHPKPTKLTGFGIAGADRKFVWADAVIEGNKVIVPYVTDFPIAPVVTCTMRKACRHLLSARTAGINDGGEYGAYHVCY